MHIFISSDFKITRDEDAPHSVPNNWKSWSFINDANVEIVYLWKKKKKKKKKKKANSTFVRYREPY
ncbi:hypothetical protein PGB90_006831 [Kerria lacca]